MSPRTKEQNDVIREQRFQQIRSAAADVYLSMGTAFEIRDVALKAGVGYGTVYHYYDNKFALLGDLLWSAFETSRELTHAKLSGVPTWSVLESFSSSLLKQWEQEPATFILYKMATEKFHQLPANVIGELPQRFEKELFAPIAEAFAGVADSDMAEESANVLIGSLVGCAGLWLYHNHPALDADRTSRLLLAGIKQTATAREEQQPC